MDRKIVYPKLMSKSGAFKRKLSKEVKAALTLTQLSSRNHLLTENIDSEPFSSTASEYDTSSIDQNQFNEQNPTNENNYGQSNDDLMFNSSENVEDEQNENNCYDDEVTNEFRYKLKEWAITYKPTQNQLKGLLSVINSTLPFKLPADPRTLLYTPSRVDIIRLGHEENYWHHGLKVCLKNVFQTYSPDKIPNTIHININVDGLPLFKSSRQKFWPILFNIHLFKEVEPQIIGIFCGKGT